MSAFVVAGLCLSGGAAYGWTVSSTDCWNTNTGEFGLSYVVSQINEGLGSGEIFFDFGPGTHLIDCGVTVTSRFVTLQTLAGDVRLRGTMDFRGGANLYDSQIDGTVYCRGSAGSINQCAFRGQLHVGDNYMVENSWFSNVTVTAGNRNYFQPSLTWRGESSTMTIGASNEVRAGSGLSLLVSGDHNIVTDVGLRYLQVNGSHNTFAGNTNYFNVTPYGCSFCGTNNIITNNLFYSGQQGSVRVTGDNNLVANNTSYSNETGFIIEGHGNTLRGNRIGVLPDGLTAAMNTMYGIQLQGDNNVVGGVDPGDRNIIARCGLDGIHVRPAVSSTTTNCLIQGNYIGLNANGDSVGGINEDGIYIWSGSGHVIGGPDDARNVIAACRRHGIRVSVPGLLIDNNVIGLSPAGDKIGLGNAGSYDGIRVNAANMTIRSNVICAATNGWGIYFTGGHNALVIGNRIGTGLAGTESYGNGRGGIYVLATNLTIGGASSSDRNIIVASRGATTNEGAGICFESNGRTTHRVMGNYIGLGADGSTLLSNAFYGILIKGTHGVTIGGTNPALGNVIAGSGVAGVALYNANENRIQANRIGTDATGEAARGNRCGVYLQGAAGNWVGGCPVPLGNLISGNYADGVRLSHATSNNYVQGNLIGTKATGAEGLGNDGYGVFLDGRISYYSQYNWIGGLTNDSTYWREGNVISGNGEGGVMINTNARYNRLDGNLIGLDTNGTALIENFGHGVHAYEGRNLIGIEHGNVICGNSGDGIRLESTRAGWSDIFNNYIGMTRGGVTNYGNLGHGVAMVGGARYNHLGDSITNGCNVIGANYGCGVYIGTNSSGNTIAGNYIGFPPEYEKNLVNEGPAIRVESSTETWIGGTSAGDENIIDGRTGIYLSNTTNTWVYGNYIGFDTNQFVVTTNLEYGIVLDNASMSASSSRQNWVGGASEAGIRIQNCSGKTYSYMNSGYGKTVIGDVVTNAGVGLILSNAVECTVRYSNIGGSQRGVVLQHTLSNRVQFCNIGAPDNDPFAPLGNAGPGVFIENGFFDTIGGEYWPNNNISGNQGHGVEIHDSTGVFVGGNNIGLNEAGDEVVANQGHGVYIENSLFCYVGGDIVYRNYIAGNAGDGVHVADEGMSAGHVIAGNRIGMFVPGWAPATNGGHGICLYDVAGVTVGGTNEDAANFISGNLGHGVMVTGALSGAHAILLNGIGADSDWTNAVPNGLCGVALYHGAGHVVAGNMIVGNLGDGLLIRGEGAREVLVEGNVIGTDTNGQEGLGNLGNGVVVVDSAENTLSNNVISGNLGNGVIVSNSTPPYSSAINNRISGNLIGTDSTGTKPLGNGDNGILISHATFTYVGLNNMIAAHLDDGIEIWNAASHDNFIHGNMIGGATNLGNLGHGVQLHGGDANRVGSTNWWEGNDISYNLGHGVAVFTGVRNPVLGNAIYSNLLMGIRLGTQVYSYAECDGCPNRYQRQPLITNVFRASTHIFGVLETEPDGEYLIEFFATETSNMFGFAEGKELLWRENFITDPSGMALFEIYYPYTTPTGYLVTATATDTNGNTSTFSPPVVVGEAPDTHGYGVPDVWQEAYTNLGYTTGDQAYTNDYDGDGMTDREEYLAGTDPESADSLLRVETGSLNVPYTSPGRVYAVERNTDLIAGGWALWEQAAGTGSNLVFDLDTAGPETSVVYRIRAAIP